VADRTADAGVVPGRAGRRDNRPHGSVVATVG
jgi:hypothetical protein